MHANPLHAAARHGRLSSLALAGAAAAVLAMPGTALAQDGEGIVDEHTVERGDTLAEIADAHDLDDWRLVFDANTDVDDPNLIIPGQVLDIPAADAALDRRPLPTEQTSTPAAPAPAPAPSEPQQTAATTTPAPAQSAPESTPAPAPEPQPEPATSASAGVWDRLAQCESGGDWSINTGNGYYGGLQFSMSSWSGVGGSGYPHEASKGEQIARAEILLDRQGWSAWPACSSKLGLR